MHRSNQLSQAAKKCKCKGSPHLPAGRSNQLSQAAGISYYIIDKGMILKNRKGIADIVDALQPVVMAFGIFMMIYVFLAQPHKVDGRSMLPNFQDQEYILTDKLTYQREDPKRFDVVVFHAPPPFDSDFIKRIIGLPGEKIKILGGYVYINGIKLDEVFLPSEYKTSERSFLREDVEYQIPENYYFLMGDNRDGSSDSREWGPVGRNAIVGKAFFRYWPPNKIGSVKR